VGSSRKGTNDEGSDAAGSGVLPVHNAKVHRKSGKAARRNKDLLKPFKAYAFQGKRETSKVKRETSKVKRETSKLLPLKLSKAGVKREKTKIAATKKIKVTSNKKNSNKQKNKRKKKNKMITVIAIFAIVITLVASELYLVYSNYKETAELKIINEKTKKLNYSSR
jgi:hypothetical protein